MVRSFSPKKRYSSANQIQIYIFNGLPRKICFGVPFLCAYKRQEMWQNKYSWNRNTKLEYLMYTKLFPYLLIQSMYSIDSFNRV